MKYTFAEVYQHLPNEELMPQAKERCMWAHRSSGAKKKALRSFGRSRKQGSSEKNGYIHRIHLKPKKVSSFFKKGAEREVLKTGAAHSNMDWLAKGGSQYWKTRRTKTWTMDLQPSMKRLLPFTTWAVVYGWVAVISASCDVIKNQVLAGHHCPVL